MTRKWVLWMVGLTTVCLTYGCISLLLSLAYVNQHKAFTLAKVVMCSSVSTFVCTESLDEWREVLRSTLEGIA
jgi:hypothetical protein